VGPRPDGTIQPEFADRLRQVGAWLKVNGDSIYGTREGPIPPADWGVTTQKGNKVYVHILNNDDNALALPKLPSRVAGAALLSGSKVALAQTPEGMVLKLDPAARDPYDTVVVLDLP
ncbi:MAG TPA: alpha-L-fucosidase, partial [Bryobacterales bacterium]|nr:alpha-L-fucosidase [Bryobacterales bacterium]